MGLGEPRPGVCKRCGRRAVSAAAWGAGLHAPAPGPQGPLCACLPARLGHRAVEQEKRVPGKLARLEPDTAVTPEELTAREGLTVPESSRASPWLCVPARLHGSLPPALPPGLCGTDTEFSVMSTWEFSV